MLVQDFFSAAKEIRTPTPFQALPPQGSASTNFAIAAIFKTNILLRLANIILNLESGKK